MEDQYAHRTLELLIEVDTNDGDYENSITRISPETLEVIMPMINTIGKNGDYQRGEMADEPMHEKYPEISREVHERFEDLCPYPEYGFHSIVSITVCPYQEKTELL